MLVVSIGCALLPWCLCHLWGSHGLSLVEDRCGGEVECKGREMSRAAAAALITLVSTEIAS